MTEKEVEAVVRLQGYGLDCRAIAEITGVNREALKTFVRRHPIQSVKPIDTDGYCRNCGRPLSYTVGHRIRLFCDQSCRMAYWNSHRDRVSRKKWKDYVCLTCGQPFKSYGSRPRKYCGRKCYHESRRKRIREG